VDQQEPMATSPPTTAEAALSEADIIARNLARLFEERRIQMGRKVPREDVAEYASKIVGESVTRWWVSRLLNGDVTAPDPARLNAVAQYFGKSASYLRARDPDAIDHDGEREKMVEEWREIAEMAEDLGAHGLNLRQLHELSPDDLGIVRSLVERLVATHNEHRPGG
jgi:transcriptional regulator with XRE-family HTH domain